MLASVAVMALMCQASEGAWAGGSPASNFSSSSVAAPLDTALLPPPPVAADGRKPSAPPRAALPSAKPHGDVTAPAPPNFSRWGSREWLLEKRDILGDAPDMVRYVANECILAGVAGAAIAVALTVSGGAVGPVAGAALGVSPEMSTLGITALGCVAGASAGVASAVAIYVYEEPEIVRDFAVEQAGNVQYAVASAAEAVAGAMRKPQETMYAAASGAWQVAASAASGAEWAASGVAYGVGSAVAAVAGATQAGAGVVLMAASEGVGSWWSGKPPLDAPEVAFDVASVPELAAAEERARVY